MLSSWRLIFIYDAMLINHYCSRYWQEIDFLIHLVFLYLASIYFVGNIKINVLFKQIFLFNENRCITIHLVSHLAMEIQNGFEKRFCHPRIFQFLI